jgi:hypothetical protein
VDVATWLRILGMEQYEPVFRDNAINAAVLPALTVDDLKDLGARPVGHRRKLLARSQCCAAILVQYLTGRWPRPRSNIGS